MKPILTLDRVSKSYQGVNGARIRALQNANLSIATGEFVCLVGRSGCGKTTTLRLIAGLDKACSGEIRLNGRPIKGPSPRRCVVFQKYTLFPWRTVLSNIAFGLEHRGIPRRRRREIAARYLALVGLNVCARAYPYELSGGMQQRVAVARALAADPEILLMDEPFGALDAQTRNVLQDELVKIWREDRKTILFVTHSITEALYLADRIVVMQSAPGRIQSVLSNDLPRPRKKSSSEFRGLYEKMCNLLEVEG